ncbi:MAG: hypothetical protein K2H89_04395, partial [Oscillospiraceae bacterium]|nr:hypothetical protein [Oscillospiraceae bacterium]
IDAYKTALNSITKQLEQENITPELRMQLSNKMIEIADKISEKDTENKNWLKQIFSSILPIISGFSSYSLEFLHQEEQRNKFTHLEHFLSGDKFPASTVLLENCLSGEWSCCCQ